MSQHPRQCNLREVNGKRSMLVQHVDRVETALTILLDICQ
jgi:transcription-repair coupling factor (superfamily II helicase)